MTDKVFDFIMQVRSKGEVNMLSVLEVQRYAHDHEMWDLVIYLEENKKQYCAFILAQHQNVWLKIRKTYDGKESEKVPCCIR